MELREGMYVRTKKGIGRVTEYTKHESWGYIVKVLGQYSCYTHTSNGELSDVIKASDNLIDLIEVGDYVNGKEVTEIMKDEEGNVTDVLFTEEVESQSYSLLPIKSIVTKERFDFVKYEVE